VLSSDDERAYRLIAFGAATCFIVAGATLSCGFHRVRQISSEDAQPTGYSALARDRLFLAFTGVNTVFALTSGMLALALPIVVVNALGQRPWLASAVLVGNTVLLSVGAAPIIKRLASYRRTRILVLAASLWIAWCLMFALLVPGAGTWAIIALIVATLIFTMAELIHSAVSMALAADLSPPDARGRYLAAFQYSFTLSGLVRPAFFAVLFEAATWLPWVTLAGLNVVALLAMLWLERLVPAIAQRESRQDLSDGSGAHASRLQVRRRKSGRV
jgi:MFS family permease